jgi:hypothetical protein
MYKTVSNLKYTYFFLVKAGVAEIIEYHNGGARRERLRTGTLKTMKKCESKLEVLNATNLYSQRASWGCSRYGLMKSVHRMHVSSCTIETQFSDGIYVMVGDFTHVPKS